VEQPVTYRPSQGLTLLYAVAAVVVVIWGMRAAAPLLIEVLLAIFIAIVCAPSLYWLQKKGCPAWLSLVVVITVLLLIAFGFIVLMGSSIASFSANLAHYKKTLTTTYQGALHFLDDTHIIEILEKVTGQDIVTSIGKALDVGKAVQFAGNTVSELGAAFGSAFMIALTTIFILLEASGFPQKLAAMSGGSTEKPRLNFNRIINDIRHYLVLKTWMCLLTGVLTGIFLFFMGIDYPFLWGTLAFLLNYIPNIGSIIAAIPAVLLGLVQFGWEGAVGVIIGYLVINGLVGNFLEPKIFGQGLGLSTLVIFLGLIFWGWILGPVGMVLSAPLTMVLKIVAESQAETRWLAILLSSDASLHTDSNQASTAARSA